MCTLNTVATTAKVIENISGGNVFGYNIWLFSFHLLPKELHFLWFIIMISPELHFLQKKEK